MSSQADKNAKLIEAVESRDLGRIGRAIDAGADPNARKVVTLTCTLKVAGLFGSKEETKTDTRDAESALAIAIIRRDPNAVELLLQRGADPNKRVEWPIFEYVPDWDAKVWERRAERIRQTFPSGLDFALEGHVRFVRDSIR